MAAEGQEGRLPPGALQLLPLIDTIATKIKVEVAFPDPTSCLTMQPACQQVAFPDPTSCLTTQPACQQVAFPDPTSCLTTQPACQQVLRLTIAH
ncbi:hypothetical protein OEZ85_000183 [Tetradesmus obliquus]|uniref:FZ domain-containing protein n=1 Tax=Tetradesmus obliquus TaxID=3088 RepID=A0ABY8UPD2_TETOB|nr:hypothetical protein OEZ85_000183 [Tetradesmus obliquus]